MLEREQAVGDPRYDILMIDAYSGDAVPYHLATLEAFRLYFERLEEDGVFAMHVSNWHVDLLPLCKAVAQALGVHPTVWWVWRKTASRPMPCGCS